MPQRCLKIPQSVVRLLHARMPGFADPAHKCYVVSPHKPSSKGRKTLPQACLVVVHNPDGTEIWHDALIVIPKDAPHSRECGNSIYAIALGLIGDAYKGAIKLVSKSGVCDFSGVSRRDVPFACTGGSKGKQWHPLQLMAGQTNRKPRAKYWHILHEWEQWQKNKLSLSDRADAYNIYWPYLPRVPIDYRKSKVKRRKPLLDAFRKKLAYLQLPSTAEALADKPAKLTRMERMRLQRAIEGQAMQNAPTDTL